MLLGGGVVAAAPPVPIYRWQDAAGSTHYSDRQPPETAVQRITPVPNGDNVIPRLSAFERRQVQRFNERVRAHLQARRSAARRMASTQTQRQHKCMAIEQELDELQAKSRAGLSLESSNRAHARAWQLQRERMHFCD